MWICLDTNGDWIRLCGLDYLPLPFFRWHPIESITVVMRPYPTFCVTIIQWLPLSFCKQNNWPLLLPLTLLKRCCTRWQVFWTIAPRVALSSSVLHATNCWNFYIGHFYIKMFVPFGAIPLRVSMCPWQPYPARHNFQLCYVRLLL